MDNKQKQEELLNQVVELLRRVVDLDDRAAPGKEQKFFFSILPRRPSERPDGLPVGEG